MTQPPASRTGPAGRAGSSRSRAIKTGRAIRRRGWERAKFGRLAGNHSTGTKGQKPGTCRGFGQGPAYSSPALRRKCNRCAAAEQNRSRSSGNTACFGAKRV
ncbi:hypothetical protein CSIRO_1816 [Bradyrhizobiaceae bacterium SG-6C]|nr:hypothetical protein CSIRO_1816 [Bradyrhizobiaceae bacterium SG-6C]